MTVRIRHQVIVVAALDANEQDVSFKREDKAQTTVNATFETEQSGEPILAASEVDFVLPMGKVLTGQFLYIESQQQLSVKLDGEATGHKIGPPATGTKGKLLLCTEFTAAPKITNLDTTNEANVSYIIAGKKT